MRGGSGIKHDDDGARRAIGENPCVPGEFHHFDRIIITLPYLLENNRSTRRKTSFFLGISLGESRKNFIRGGEKASWMTKRRVIKKISQWTFA